MDACLHAGDERVMRSYLPSFSDLSCARCHTHFLKGTTICTISCVCQDADMKWTCENSICSITANRRLQQVNPVTGEGGVLYTIISDGWILSTWILYSFICMFAFYRIYLSGFACLQAYRRRD